MVGFLLVVEVVVGIVYGAMRLMVVVVMMSIVGIIDAIVSSTLTVDTSDPCNQHHHAQHGHIEYTRRFDDENNLQHQQHTTIQHSTGQPSSSSASTAME